MEWTRKKSKKCYSFISISEVFALLTLISLIVTHYMSWNKTPFLMHQTEKPLYELKLDPQTSLVVSTLVIFVTVKKKNDKCLALKINILRCQLLRLIVTQLRNSSLNDHETWDYKISCCTLDIFFACAYLLAIFHMSLHCFSWFMRIAVISWKSNATSYWIF